MKGLRTNESGLGHVMLIAVAVVVFAGIGFAGWTVMQKNKDKTDTNSATSAASSKAITDSCKKAIDDNDLCKFFGSWDGNQKFAVLMTDTRDGATTTSTYKIDGKNTYIKTDGDTAMEMIMIGDDTYTKAGDVWWKKAGNSTPSTDTTATDSMSVDPDEFKLDEPTADESGPQYKKLGKEACGSLTCFKYQLLDSTDASSKTYLWFDDDEYMLRILRVESSDGSVSEQKYSYDNVSVTVPSPVKELAENQYIIPGQTEPMTMPSFDQ